MRGKILKNKIVLLLEIILLILVMMSIPMGRTVADVGSFEDYDSGSDWGSSWDSDSSWSSSDWDSDSSWSSSSSDYSYSSGGSGINIIGFGGIAWWIILIIVFIVIKLTSKNKNNHIPNYTYTPTVSYNDAEVERKIKQVDPNFNKTEFESFAKEVFIKLQNAWTERDWEKIRPFESEELFAQHKAQLDGYIKNNQINVMDRISVNGMHLVSFEQSGEKDILKIDLSTRMSDYIIDATTKQVIKGDRTKEYYHVYTLTFIRKKGNITVSGGSGLNTTNCPNCGAPTTITSSGRCEYCNSVITTEDHGWVLSNLTRKS